METLARDVRYALRQLRRDPGFTMVAIATLALGIGANTAMFSLVRGVLLRPLPYRDVDRLVATNLSIPDYEDLVAASKSFEATAVWASNMYLLGAASSAESGSEQVLGGVVSGAFFPILGEAALGRTLTAADEHEKVVVLGHRLWTRRFGADPSALGRSLHIGGEPYTVVGVMPPDFQYPSARFELWVPFGPVRALAPQQVTNRGLRIFRGLARLKPGVTHAAAQAEVATISARLAREHPATNQGVAVNLTPVAQLVVGGVRTPLYVLMGVVGLVLLIACANVANLLLSRAKGRQREIAIRTALGAGRGRVARQLLTESVLLAVAGSAAGVLVAAWILDALPGLVPAGTIPRLSSVALDPAVLAFTTAVAVFTGVLFGLAPAWQATRADAADGLRDGRGSAGPASRRLRGVLTAAEVALSLVVLVGAGLLVQSLVRLLRVDAGFVADNVLSFNVQMLGGRAPAQRAALAAAITERIAGVPGVTAVGGGTGLPPVTAQRGTAFVVDGLPAVPGDDRRSYFLAVTPDYFRALGTPLFEGRAFTAADAFGAPDVVILNRTLARRLFGAEGAIGRRVRLVNPEYPDTWRTVVGVVGDVRYSGLDDPGEAALYTPFAQTPFLWTYMMVRTSVPPMDVARAVRQAVKDVDPALEAAALRPLAEVVFESVAQPRFHVVLLSSFAILALALAAVGIYGVMSYSVAQRTREIGIRMALGADRGVVLRLVTGEGLRLALAGVVVGLLGAAGATRVLSGLLFDLRPLDAPTFAGAAACLGLVALAASAIPALRATRVAPMAALRQE